MTNNTNKRHCDQIIEFIKLQVRVYERTYNQSKNRGDSLTVLGDLYGMYWDLREHIHYYYVSGILSADQQVELNVYHADHDPRRDE